MAPFDRMQGRITRHILVDIDRSRGPENLHAGHLHGLPQAKRQGQFVLREVTPASVHRLPEHLIASMHAHFGTNAVTVAFRPAQVHPQVMRLTRRVVAKQECRTLVLAHQNIQIAIAIVIGIGSTAAYQELIQAAPGWWHNFRKPASTKIAEELRWLGTGSMA